jgi:hypothetical protein
MADSAHEKNGGCYRFLASLLASPFSLSAPRVRQLAAAPVPAPSRANRHLGLGGVKPTAAHVTALMDRHCAPDGVWSTGLTACRRLATQVPSRLAIVTHPIGPAALRALAVLVWCVLTVLACTGCGDQCKCDGGPGTFVRPPLPDAGDAASEQ